MLMNIAAPFIWPVSGWLGQDGNWSTFSVAIGNPPQNFQILPSTSNHESWIPVPEGCSWIASLMPQCPQSRGVISSPQQSSSGFMSNASSSWQSLGLFQLSTESDLFPSNENGYYGLDHMTIGSNASSLDARSQVVAGISTQDFWIGSVGLTAADSDFGLSSLISSLLVSLATDGTIPSVSYGYAAGAWYKSRNGSLILGGHDSNATGTDLVTYPIGTRDNLVVNLAGVVATNTLQGTKALVASSNGLTMEIDSAVSQLWLPTDICDSFAAAFGLLYDNKTNLYLVNDTLHAKLRELSPVLTFQLALGPASETKTNIIFPYSAFDLTIGLPTYNETYLYFPLRRAANESQYVLGRVFFQEAYLIVDWERRNFSIGQDRRQGDSIESVVAIRSLNATSVEDEAHRPGIGMIIGIAVGAVAVISLIIALFVWHLRRRKGSKLCAVPIEHQDLDCSIDEKLSSPLSELTPDTATTEAMSSPLHELDDFESKKPALLMSSPVYELPGDFFSQEMAARSRPCSYQKA